MEQVLNTQIYKISVNYYTHFTKTVLQIIFTHKKIHLHSKRGVYVGVCVCVCWCFLEAASNFALSFLFSVTLGGKLLRIFMPVLNVFVGKQVRLAFDL